MISAIIPTYRNSTYLDLCLRSATENRQNEDTEIIVIVDGYPEESEAVLAKYDGVRVLDLPQNMGMQFALNVGVMNATNEWVFILNDDNVFGKEWDSLMEKAISAQKFTILDMENTCIQINQVEPMPSIFDYLIKDLGKTASDFKYDEWLEFEPTVAQPEHYTPNGRLFPFLLTKRWYMTVGGFDTFYKSPFWVDCDFWLKLELTKQIKFRRWHGCHLYHFASAATKGRKDAESKLFIKSEHIAAQTFGYKWGFVPDIVESAKSNNNSKLPNVLPLDKPIKGIRFR